MYQNEYFGYLEQAIAYKDKIIDFIDKNIDSNFHRYTPFALISLGSFYIFYNSNKSTTWYVFFEKKESIRSLRFVSLFQRFIK